MKDRVVLLTGGSRGIGSATVRALHACGSSVLFTFANREDEAALLCAELGDRVGAVRCDLARSETLPAVVDECLRRFGRIDVLVNNAGIFEYNPFFGTDYAAWIAGWQRTFAVNLFGTANITWLVLQQMRKRGSGKIINIASRSAHRGELDFADYGSSKAAMVNLTKSIARSCAPYGIVSIAIAPGFIETEMAAEELENRRAEIEAEIPARRIGSAQEVASIVTFFAGPAGDYANGATIDVNGGSYVR
ncbi:MAG: SDR family oxidoreductase [Candidatus Eremiobacteraeota bacterium]|nr:SDR family oxidoreductase [Candidatus Eremiobacteraeota bacterium]